MGYYWAMFKEKKRRHTKTGHYGFSMHKGLYFSPMEDFEKKEFRSQGELMDCWKVPLTYVRRSVTKACVSAGYHIG